MKNIDEEPNNSEGEMLPKSPALLREIMAADPTVTLDEVAGRTGMGRKALSAFLAGTYDSDIAGAEAMLESLLNGAAHG